MYIKQYNAVKTICSTKIFVVVKKFTPKKMNNNIPIYINDL